MRRPRRYSLCHSSWSVELEVSRSAVEHVLIRTVFLSSGGFLGDIHRYVYQQHLIQLQTGIGE